MKRILLTSDKTNYYHSKLWGLANGFKQLGLEAMVIPDVPFEEQMYTLCREWKPDIIFEINRSKADLPDLPKEVIHINNQQDMEFGRIFKESKSDITYFPINPELIGYKYLDNFNSVLMMGVDPDKFYQEGDKEHDFIFCGFIPKPIDQTLMNQSVFNYLGIVPYERKCTVGEVFEEFTRRAKQSDAKYDKLISSITEIIHEKLAHNFNIRFDDKLKDDLQYTVFRTVERKFMVESVLAVSEDTRLYGPYSWTLWPEYCLYYYGHLVGLEALRKAYSKARVLLHNGNWTAGHWRVPEGMACGNVVMIQETPHDDKKYGILEDFEPYVDYIPWNEDNIKEQAKKALKDKFIGENAKNLVLDKHTWKHRAEQILNDIRKIT